MEMTASGMDGSHEAVASDELRDIWPLLSRPERIEAFRVLAKHEAEELLLELPGPEQAELILDLPPEERRSWMRLLPPDDAADVLQAAPSDRRGELLGLLDEQTRLEVTALLAYAEDEAGGLMSPAFARLRPDMSVDEAIRYLRKQAQGRLATVYYLYVLDQGQRLLGVLSFRELFTAAPDRRVRDVMHGDVIAAPEEMDQEELSRLFARHDLLAIPVVDGARRMKGIVTFDDIVDVVQEEATEDIHKLGGQEALDEPYLKVGFWSMVKKRGGWLSALFIGEMLTATAMGHYEAEIARAVVLSVFIPLIISSGGNSGSQASTLVVRAMALGEVKLRHWWRIVRREVAAGLLLGAFLGSIGLARISIWQALFHMYGPHHLRIALTVGGALVGVVTFGTLAGSMLPFILRGLRLDPASASAPLVATLVDVTGLVIYFTVASVMLRGTLL